MLSVNCTEALSIQANVTISCSSAKLIKNGIAPLPFPPRAARAILLHKARGEGQGEGTCSILCNVSRGHCYFSALLHSIKLWSSMPMRVFVVPVRRLVLVLVLVSPSAAV